MDIQKEREAFEAYMAEKYKNLVDRRRCLNNGGGYMAWDMNVAWQVWLAAKAQAIPEGSVLVEKSKVRTWYQDDDEPENFCNSESDLDCLGDCLDDDDIIAVNIYESAHISTRKVFGVWKSNSPTDIQSKFILVDSYEEAEKIVASNKAMIEAQEPAND